METTTFEYFDKSFENFIIKQSKSKIKNSIDNFSYGFKLKLNNKYIYSFILCKNRFDMFTT